MKLKFKAILGAATLVAGMFASMISASANPLHDAVLSGNQDMVKTLCEEHPEWISEHDRRGRFPIHYASKLDVLKVLVGHGANINASVYISPQELETYPKGRDFRIYRNNAGQTPLMYCVSHHMEIARYLVEQGADVNAKDIRGNTILHHLISYLDINYAHKTEFIEFLLGNGADINARNNEGKTPLDVAEQLMDANMDRALMASREEERYEYTGRYGLVKLYMRHLEERYGAKLSDTRCARI